MNIANWLHAAARVHPHAPALFSGDTLRADYATFALRASSLARVLADEHGIAAGDRVAVFARNCVEYLEVLYAVWWAGAVVVPVNHKLHPAEAAWIIEHAEASVVFTDAGATFGPGQLPAGCAERAIEGEAYRLAANSHGTLVPPHEAAPDDLAWLFYTSGTTGRPKGVMLSHANLVAMSTSYPIDVDPVSPADAALYAAPMSHGAGLYNFIHVRHAARHVVPESRGFVAAEIFALARTLRQVSMFAAPTMIKRMVDEARRSGSTGDGIKSVIYGGGPMYVADIKEALAVLGPRFIQIYGQGESPMTITALGRSLVAGPDHAERDRILASVGTAQSCVDVKVVDEHMNALPPGVPGEVAVRGATVMRGYWRNEEATRQSIVDGWLRTGDVGYLSEDGFLTLTDRSKDVIISGGTNIYPREVEEVLTRHEAVAEVSVVGERDAEWGEIVVAFVVPLAGATLDDATLEHWCRQHIASFKKPKRYVFCSELPKNSYGKVLKTELRKQLLA
ncbi:AMP-binding protein [Thauera sp. CAU 1555]|uniref:AMP-binding protein n=1 Tax=Thauera sedimentorum TaxID=2767595 RepID=A0ABR9BDI5_9RHOO|nr:AMP-binding protein [Thauera sedimentorum]MBC9072636.1 AMP-binding protein [Thauera sedimentorum]MBD8503555.1 AMP-binding protein [Thauera sedimentorum]